MTDVTDPLTYLRATHAAAQADAEAAAYRAWSPHWEYDDLVNEIRDLNNGNTLANIYFPEIGKHIAAHDPAAVVRRVKAERETLAACEAVLAVVGWEYDDAPNLAERAIRALAEGWGWTPEEGPSHAV